MWGILGFLAKFGGFLLDRFWPSKDRELGRAEAERDGLKEDARRVNEASAAVRRNRADPKRLRDKARKSGRSKPTT